MNIRSHQAALAVAISVLLLFTACSLASGDEMPSAIPTAISSLPPTVPQPTDTPAGIPGLDSPLPFDDGQIQITAARLMENTSDVGDFPYPLPPSYKAADANDIILAVIAVPFGADPSALASKWKDLEVKIVDENGRESKPDIQGSGEQNGNTFVMWITAVSRTAKEFTLYLAPDVKLNITSLLSK